MTHSTKELFFFFLLLFLSRFWRSEEVKSAGNSKGKTPTLQESHTDLCGRNVWKCFPGFLSCYILLPPHPSTSLYCWYTSSVLYYTRKCTVRNNTTTWDTNSHEQTLNMQFCHFYSHLYLYLFRLFSSTFWWFSLVLTFLFNAFFHFCTDGDQSDKSLNFDSQIR